MIALLLAAALAQADGGQALPPLVFPDCPDPGPALATQDPDGGEWHVPAARMAALECRYDRLEQTARGDPRVTVERSGVSGAAAAGGLLGTILSVAATILALWRPWERRCPGP